LCVAQPKNFLELLGGVNVFGKLESLLKLSEMADAAEMEMQAIILAVINWFSIALNTVAVFQHSQKRRKRGKGRGHHGRHQTRSYQARYGIKPTSETSLTTLLLAESIAARRVDVFYDLFKVCEPWLQLPLWMSGDAFENDFQVIPSLEIARNAALLHRAGNTGGRPRDASSPLNTFGYTWNFLRARSS